MCICDDLPHIVEPFNEDQKNDPYSELLEADLSLSVSYGRTLTVSASESTNHYASKCDITPNYEVVIPPETIWTAGAAVTVDFKVRLCSFSAIICLYKVLFNSLLVADDYP